MEDYDPTTRLLHQHLEQLSLDADQFTEQVQLTAEAIVDTAFAEKKVFVIGLGSDSIPAQALGHLLEFGLERDRPSIPCIPINSTQHSRTSSATVWAANRLRGLGQPDDLVVVFNQALVNEDIELITKVIDQRAMNACWLSPADSNEARSTMTSHSIQLMVALAVGHLADVLAFGPMTTEA